MLGYVDLETRSAKSDLEQKKMGLLSKVKAEGPFIDEWKQAYSTISNEVEEVDIAATLSSAALSVKDEKELVSSKHAHARLCLDADPLSVRFARQLVRRVDSFVTTLLT